MIRVFPDAESLSSAAADLFVQRAAESIEELGRFAVALSGGKTPRRAYEILASDPLKDEVDWPRVHFFFGDDRYVPTSDELSNERMARQALLDHVPVVKEHIHGIYRPDGPESSAKAYESLLRAFFADGAPQFDLAYSGLGPDGHTASLFGDPAPYLADPRWVIPTKAPVGAPDRVSLNVALLAGAQTLAFLVDGAEKAEALRYALTPTDHPASAAQVVAARAINPVWYVDAQAAALLPPGTA